MNRQELRKALSRYPGQREEQIFVAQFLSLMEHPDCYQRTHLPGHLTGSAWIVNPTMTRVLLVHHGKLNRWMQPGGHADGDENIFQVACREAEEETGIQRYQSDHLLFDIDIHQIPARPDFPAHDHYDVRFLLIADDAQPVVVSHESHDVKWIDLSSLHLYSSERSVLRMKEKLHG